MELIEKYLGEGRTTSITAKNLKKGMNIHKFGKVDDVSKQGHIVIAYSGKNKKKYDELESITIDENIGMGLKGSQLALAKMKQKSPTAYKTGSSTQMQCMECGNKFKKKLSRKTFEVKCPKCKGYDTEPA